MISIFVVASLVALGFAFEHKWNLSRWYISPPLAGGGVGVFSCWLLYKTSGFSWTPSDLLVHILVTSFLFSIGIKIGLVYTKRHVIHINLLISFCFNFHTFFGRISLGDI